MIYKFKYDYLLVLIAIAWALFFSFVLQLQPHFNPLGDDATYLYSAQIFYKYGSIDNTRPVLISIIFGLPYLFGFSSFTVIKWGLILNFIAWIFTAIMLFKIVALQFSRKTAFVCALVFLFCIGNLAHSFRFLTESIFIFFLTSAIYFLQRFFVFNQPKNITISIAILLFIALIKPIALVLAIVVFVYFIQLWKRIVSNRFLPFVFLAMACIFYQMYSVKKRYGDFTISYISSITYYNYLGCKAYCYKNNIEYLPGNNKRTQEFIKLNPHQMKQIASADFKNQLKNNFPNLCKAYLFCIYSNSSKGNYIVSQCNNHQNTFYFEFFRFLFKAISKMQNILFTCIGVVLSAYFIVKFNLKKSFYAIVSWILLTLFFISAISCFESDRFHIVFFPIVIVLSLKFSKLNLSQ